MPTHFGLFASFLALYRYPQQVINALTGKHLDFQFRNVLKFSTFAQAAASIKNLENLRREFARKKDQEGLRRVRETALKGKQRAQMIARNRNVDEQKRAEKLEIAEWFAVWLKQPEIFSDWHELRQRSQEFRERFKESAHKTKG